MAKKALVVGINAYSAPNALPSCINDADAFASYLKVQNGFQTITNYRDAQASRSAILAGLHALLANARDDDELVFYFSGHGYSYQDGDAHIDALVSQDSAFLTTDDMTAATAAAPPGVLTVVLDSCFSGGMQKVFALYEGVRPVKIKFWTPSPVPSQALGPLPPIRVYKAFGTPEGLDPRILANPPYSDKAFSLVEPTPAGTTRHFILVSACRSDETAAASTERTEGRSAFTYSFLKEIATASASTSVTALLEATGRTLHSLGVTQTPMLKVPKAPPHLESQPFLHWGASTSMGTARSSNSILFTPSITGKKGQTMGQPAFDKDWLSDVASIVQTVTPVIAGALKDYQPQLSGFSPPTPLTSTDKAWFDDIARVVATVVPAVVQGMRTVQPPAKAFSNQHPEPFDKNWFDNLTNIAVAVVPHVIAALKGYDPRQGGALSEVAAAAQKGWFDDVTRTVAHILPVVLAAAKQAPITSPEVSKGFEVLSGNGVDEKGFFDIVSNIARIAVPIAVSVL